MTTLTTATNSKKIHKACLAFMSLLKRALELIFIFIIVGVFRSHNVGMEEPMALFRLVVVFCAGAHVVGIWVYLNMNKWGSSDKEV